MTATIDSVLFSLWRASWSGALAFLFVWLACRLLSRRLSADAHCWLWRLSYVKLLAGLLWGGAIILPLLAPPAHPLAPAPPQSVSAPHPVILTQMPALSTNRMSAVAEPEPQPQWNWQDDLAAAYVVGVLICLGRLLIAARRTQQTLRSVTPIPSEKEAAILTRLAETLSLHSVPALARSTFVASPVLIAGTILLPAEANYREAELTMILAHELAHVRRRDLFWEWFGTGVHVLFFFHPGMVIARREERLAREAAADALALKVTSAPAADYGNLLLSLALAQTKPRPPLLGAVGVIEGGTPLRRRLLALRDPGSRRSERRIALVLVPTMAFVFIPWQMTRGQALAPGPVPPASDSPTLDLSPTSSPASATVPTIGDKKVIGVVVNDKNEPVVGLSVSLDWRWNQKLKNGNQQIVEHSVPPVVTDAQGKFAFSKLLEGDYTYDVRSPANQYAPMQGAFVLGKSETQKDLRVVASIGGLVSGRVVDGQTGKPLGGIFVVAGSIPPGGDLAKWDYWQTSNFVSTDAQGNYQIRVLSGNSFVGVGRADNGTIMSKRVREAVQQVNVVSGQTVTAPDLSVLLYPIVVFVGPDGKPVANAQVRIIPDDLGHGGYILNDSTDSSGTLVLNRFDSGSFHIQQGSLVASGTFRCPSSEPLMVTLNGRTEGYPSGTATVHLTEGSAGIVAGTVVSEDGRPIFQARVHISELTHSTHSLGDYAVGDYVFSTDKAGTFRAPLDPAGQYRVYIRADGFNQVSVSGDQSLTVAKGATVNLGILRLVRADGFVAGRVVDSTGKPMAGILVYVRGGQTFLSSAVTDDKGHFHIPNVVVGDVVHLKLCLKGESPDSGEALSQSNDEMDLPDTTASGEEREIVWNPHA